MNSKYVLPVFASMMVLMMVVSSMSPAFAAVTSIATIGPKLVVVTIPQDDQKRQTGVIVLGLTPTVTAPTPWPKPYQPGTKLISQHKIMVTFNGLPILWNIQTPSYGPKVVCNVLEKDKVNPIPDKLGKPTAQFPEENLVTKLIDVSDLWFCKLRWVTYAPGVLESIGVLDVYYIGPLLATVIADNILTVEVFMKVGTTSIVGTDIQDICLLGWSMGNNHIAVTLPDGGQVYHSWDQALGPFVSCEEAALWQRYYSGVAIAGILQD